MAPLSGCWRRHGAFLLTLLVRALAGGGSSSSGTCHSTEHHRWWNDYHEYMHLENWVLASLAIVTVFLELGLHSARHASEESHSHGHGDAKVTRNRRRYHELARPLYTTLIDRGFSELMLLGSLSFIVWGVQRLRILEHIASGLCGAGGLPLPTEESGYLHVVEDVHMQLFITMVMFFAMCAVAVRYMNARQSEWKEANKRIVDSFRFGENEEGGPELEAWEKVFRKSRVDLFRHMQQWKGHWELLDEHAMPLCKALEAQEILADDVVSPELGQLLERWFPFHRFCSLQVSLCLHDLLEVKAGTWLFIAVHLIISAALLQVVKAAWVHWLFMVSLVLLSVLFGAVGVKAVAGLKTRDEIALQQAIGGGQLHGALNIHRFQWGGLLITTVQLFIVCWCFAVTRMWATSWIWEDSTTTPVVFVVISLISVPVFGFLVGKVLLKMSLWMVMGRLPLQDCHVNWLTYFMEEHVTHQSHTLSSVYEVTTAYLDPAVADEYKDWARKHGRPVFRRVVRENLGELMGFWVDTEAETELSGSRSNEIKKLKDMGAVCITMATRWPSREACAQGRKKVGEDKHVQRVLKRIEDKIGPDAAQRYWAKHTEICSDIGHVRGKNKQELHEEQAGTKEEPTIERNL